MPFLTLALLLKDTVEVKKADDGRAVITMRKEEEEEKREDEGRGVPKKNKGKKEGNKKYFT